MIGEGSLHRVRSAYLLPDLYPVTPGHTLVVPARHIDDYIRLTAAEVIDIGLGISTARQMILQRYDDIDGFNIGINIGVAAGQTIEHAHVHVIPRRFGDTARPEGGVRGVIPERSSYLDQMGTWQSAV
jgi:diadenosine tetraphosphate (Ap4A) HIT family hydrolase